MLLDETNPFFIPFRLPVLVQVAQHRHVLLVYPQIRYVTRVQTHYQLTIFIRHIEIRRHLIAAALIERPAETVPGLGIEMTDFRQHVFHLLLRHVQTLPNPLKMTLVEVRKILVYDPRGHLIGRRLRPSAQLYQQTIAQVIRPDSGRVHTAYRLQHSLHLLITDLQTQPER